MGGEREAAAVVRMLWTKELNGWWVHYNLTYQTRMRMPTIAIADGQTRLGSWDSRRRLLTISERHIVESSWLEVLDTLRHEMAHQYADEVLGAHGEPPHGPSFQRACKLLRADARASAAASDDGALSARGRKLDIIKKLLSLGGSPNQNEAESALRKAREILVRYNLDIVENDDGRKFSARALGRVMGRHHAYETTLGSILCEFFFVESIWVDSYDPRTLKRGKVLRVFGTAANLEMAEYVYDYLVGVLDSLWRAYRREIGTRSNRGRLQFFEGVLQGFRSKLHRQTRQLSTERALVWQGDPELRDYCQNLYPFLETRRRRRGWVDSNYDAGVRAGEHVTIHKPVETNGGFGGYLGP